MVGVRGESRSGEAYRGDAVRSGGALASPHALSSGAHSCQAAARTTTPCTISLPPTFHFHLLLSSPFRLSPLFDFLLFYVVVVGIIFWPLFTISDMLALLLCNDFERYS